MVSNLTVKVGADVAGLQKELQKATGSLQGFSKNMSAIGSTLGGLFATGALISFGKGILDVTAQFEKFESVLTNTLGSRSAAKQALAQISEFAAKTPFQVDELTGSFVKLANQGFLPTMNQMTSLGDLASAMGKSFDQLTEAIIDAQTGEFERLKEFGIRAQKQGDKVSFTFKGVKTQVDFTSDSIRNYILSLGKAEGVSGGMAMQSETLGGKISNLKDAFGQLQLAMGQLLTKGGVVNSFIEGLARTMQMAAGTFKGDAKLGAENLIAKLKELQSVEKKGSERWIMLNDEILAAEGALRRITATQERQATSTQTVTTKVQEQTASLKQLIAEWDRQHSIWSKPFNPADQIQSRTGNQFLFDSGAMVEMANAPSRALEYLNKNLRLNANEFQVWKEQVSAHMQTLAERIELDFTPIIHSALAGIGQALGSAISGSENLGRGLLKVFGGILVQLGEMVLAAGLGVEAFKKSLQSLNGVVAIAAGVGLIALGTAISGSIKSLGSSAGGGSRGSSPSGSSGSRGSIESNGLEIKMGGEWRIQGADLVYIFNRQQQLNGRTRG
jgi:hypothetical protein